MFLRRHGFLERSLIAARSSATPAVFGHIVRRCPRCGVIGYLLLQIPIPRMHDRRVLAQAPCKFIKDGSAGSLERQQKRLSNAVGLLLRKAASPRNLGLPCGWLNNNAFPCSGKTLNEDSIFRRIVKPDRVRDGEFYERSPEITAQSRKRTSICGKDIARRSWCQKHIATSTNLDGDVRYCLNEFVEVPEAKLAFVERRALRCCQGDEVGFDQCARYRAMALTV